MKDWINAVTMARPLTDSVSKDYLPRTLLGIRLLALRRAYVANGGRLINAEQLDGEMRIRRGGAMKDWIKELCPEIAEWQAELIAEAVQKAVKEEREACARTVERARLQLGGEHGLTNQTDHIASRIAEFLAAAVRARATDCRV